MKSVPGPRSHFTVMSEQEQRLSDKQVEEALEKCQELLGYRFKNVKYLREALTHASIAHTRVESNERLEFLGDAVLGLIICEELYNRFPDLLEGELTRLKSEIVSRAVCAKITRQIGLSKFIFLGKGMLTKGGRLPTSLLAAVLESVIAAIYLDSDLETARKFVLNLMRKVVDEVSRPDHLYNFKSQLQHYAQKYFNQSPRYELMDEQGPDHSKCFEVGVRLGGKLFPTAWGKSKKEAEQEAARLALTELGVIKAEGKNAKTNQEVTEEKDKDNE